MSGEAGKGSTQRPTDQEAFAKGWEAIDWGATRIDGGKTGWPPGLLQDDSRQLGKWFASKLDAREIVRRQFEKQKEEGK